MFCDGCSLCLLKEVDCDNISDEKKRSASCCCDLIYGCTRVRVFFKTSSHVIDYAGVFLLARCSPLLEYCPKSLTVISIVGGMTAFFAATTALVQNDLKRVIAYSTCSQLGYMVFACGLSNYSVARDDTCYYLRLRPSLISSAFFAVKTSFFRVES